MSQEGNNSGEHKSKPEQRIEIPVDGDIVLKQLVMDDTPALFEVLDSSREHLSQFGDKTSENYPTLESYQLRALMQDPDEFRFGIWDGDKAVGFIKLTAQEDGSAEIGYWLGKDSTGSGYMTKSTEALTRYAQNTLGFDELFADVVKGNDASLAVLQRAGYEIVGDVPDDTSKHLLKFKGTGEQE